MTTASLMPERAARTLGNTVERRQRVEDGADIRCDCRSRHVEAGYRRIVLDAGHLQDDVVHLPHHLVGALQAGTGRQDDNHCLVTDVLIGNEPTRQARHLQTGERNQAQVDHTNDGGRPDEARGQLAITVRQPLKTAIEVAEPVLHESIESTWLRMGIVRLQQDRAQSRAQRQ
jgi:hypothetical protein